MLFSGQVIDFNGFEKLVRIHSLLQLLRQLQSSFYFVLDTLDGEIPISLLKAAENALAL